MDKEIIDTSKLKKQSTGQSKDLNIITKLSHEVSYRHFRFCFVSVCTVQTEKLTSKEERWNLFSKLSYNIEVWVIYKEGVNRNTE